MRSCSRQSCFLLLFALALVSRSGFASNFATQYAVRLWQTEDGLPQNSVQAVTQTRDGYLWIGTQQGLARFDGVRFVLFMTRQSRNCATPTSCLSAKEKMAAFGLEPNQAD